MIRVDNLKKSYGRTEAVKGISFETEPGEFFGLLGPNGAGKTTTISIISGLLKPSAGSVQVDGRVMSPDAADVKKVMGVVPQEIALYEDLTARENLMFWGGLYDLGKGELKTRVETVLQQIGLTDRAGDAAKKYSGGMKRRLNLGLALLHRPKVLLLDEPTVGVDPQARINILEVIKQVVKEGTTVLYTTHYMQEAEELCDRIAIMDHGEILAQDTVAGLRRLVGEGDLLTVKGRFSPEQLLGALADDVTPVNLEEGSGMLSVHGHGGASRTLQGLLSRGINIDQFSVKEATLEQVFIKLTGRELRD